MPDSSSGSFEKPGDELSQGSRSAFVAYVSNRSLPVSDSSFGLLGEDANQKSNGLAAILFMEFSRTFSFTSEHGLKTKGSNVGRESIVFVFGRRDSPSISQS